jgi:hypothetical protein
MKNLIATAAALLILAWLISIRSHWTPLPSKPATPVAATHSLFPRRPAPSIQVSLQSTESPSADLSFSNFIALLLKGLRASYFQKIPLASVAIGLYIARSF